MTITATREPSPYSFIGNSIIFEFTTDSLNVVDMNIIVDNEALTLSYYPFQQDGLYRIKVDLSGYLYIQSETSEYPQGDIISTLPDFSIPYQVKIGTDYSFNGVAFNGGVDNQTLSVLGNEGFDIFSYRLGSHFEQFLFTTRTHSKILRLRESELYPFVFIHPGIDISFKSDSGKIIIVPAQAESTVCVMDVEAIRLNFLYQFGETPNVLEVWTADEKAFTIQIVPKQISEESYLIRFKNSLGAYEVIEVVGSANHEPKISEPKIYQSLTEFGFYADRRERLSIQDVIKVETGYKTKDEILFIRDMVCSGETYFIYPDRSFFRCNVSVDKIAYQQKQVAPTSIPLIITNENDSRFVSPHLDWNSLISRAGIFDETFDDTFE